MLRTHLLLPAACAALVACSGSPGGDRVELAGMTLPAGFTATLFAEGLVTPRHIAVARNGDVYVTIRSGQAVALAHTPSAANMTATLPMASLRLHSQTERTLASPSR